MSKFLLALLLSLTSSFALAQANKAAKGVTYQAQIIRVIDGDTVAFAAPWLPDPLKKELSIRVFGVDTPEKGHRAKCPAEDALGQAATTFTRNTVMRSTNVQVVLMDWDKYGGRVLGDVIVDGRSLRQMLIERKYAREYYGEAKGSWC